MSRTILALLSIFFGIFFNLNNAQAATVYTDLASWQTAIPYLAPAVEVPLTWPTGTIVPWGSTFVSATGDSYVQINGYGDAPESAWSPDGASICVQTGIGGDPRLDFGLYNATTFTTITTNVIAMEVTATSPTSTLEPGSTLSGTGYEWTTASQGFLGMAFVDSSYYYYIIDYTRTDTLCIESLWIVEDTDNDSLAGDLDCDEVDNDGDGSDACTDCDDANASIYPGTDEWCNGYDDDCDGAVDEAGSFFEAHWYRDADGDGYGDPADQQDACTQPSGYVSDYSDCDDTDASIYPGASEYCNGYDDDCDGFTDENSAIDASTWYRDTDSDGYGNLSSTTVSCSALSGYVSDNTDCDDTRALTNPGADEYCNSLDDDCDGTIDEDSAIDAVTWYRDEDGDGYGVDTLIATMCYMPSGYAALADDCDDSDPLYNPGASETDCADPNDYNCDGSVAYTDADKDGFAACEECNDADAETFPGATEFCDGHDDNCDGVVDEDTAVDASTWYLDTDTDDYGVDADTMIACNEPSGYSALSGDCNDTDPLYNPAAIEDDCKDPNDYNCDGSTGYADVDDDGWAACAECDDYNAAIHPEADEVCEDGIDQDCDGVDPVCDDDTGDTADSGDTSVPDDSGETADTAIIDTGDTDDTNDTAITPPSDSGWADGKVTGGGGLGCGPNGPNCSSSGLSPSWFGLLVGMLALVRRRR